LSVPKIENLRAPAVDTAKTLYCLVVKIYEIGHNEPSIRVSIVHEDGK